MAQQDFFPARPEVTPQIYAYSDVRYPGQLKIGYTTRDVKERVAEQYPVKTPGAGLPYTIVFEESSIRENGTAFTDKAVHRWLKKHGFVNTNGEWFRCSVGDVRAAVYALKHGIANNQLRSETFGMRPEQRKAVEKTSNYFENYRRETGKTPHFLWNCKMRFGKTFAAYQLAKKMGWKKILVLTFKPAVESAWEEDLKSHVDFNGWQFVSRTSELNYEDADSSRPVVWFGSFQDFLGKNKAGGIKLRNEWAHKVNWDVVIFDEYHYGAWRENAKDLFYTEDKAEQDAQNGEALDYFDEENMPITTNHYLYLSGTPFRAINSGEFIEEQIYNWTYSDEQKAKEEWMGKDNPYASLPRMVLMTYQLPEMLVQVANEGEFDEFDLNEFFSASAPDSASVDYAIFNHENEVQKWLDLIRGAYKENIRSDLKLKADRPPMPFSHAPLLRVLNHTFWFLPSVASCYAMRNLLQKRNNVFYHDFKVIVAAGTGAGIGVEALPPVYEAMGNPLESRTITLSCGKLTTGVSVKPWSGIFMLRNSSSPETYFQAAFRVQTPWTIKNPTGDDPNRSEIMKQECYIFDFAPNRALRQIAEYSCRLNVEETQPEKKVEEFINFLPVLAYDGSHMKQIDAAGILDIAMSGTSATLLARRWESALLVNVDNVTLQRLMNSKEAMKALMSIEGFRSLNKDIQTIINKSDAIKKAKAKANEKELTHKEKHQLTEDEKEMKSKRKMIQEKLIKFATRIPVFMYLTDYREQLLKDVITQLEPGLFKKVTGLEIKDFELLVSLNVFNSALMNDAVYKFKRYEDASLEYIGFDNSQKDINPVGGYDTVLTRPDFNTIYKNIDDENTLRASKEYEYTEEDAEEYVESLLRECREIRRRYEWQIREHSECLYAAALTNRTREADGAIEEKMEKRGAYDLIDRGHDFVSWVLAIFDRIIHKSSNAAEEKNAIVAKRAYLTGITKKKRDAILKYVSCLAQYYKPRTEHEILWKEIFIEGLNIKRKIKNGTEVSIFDPVYDKNSIFNTRTVHSVIGRMIVQKKYNEVTIPKAAKDLNEKNYRTISHDMNTTLEQLGFTTVELENMIALITK